MRARSTTLALLVAVSWAAPARAADPDYRGYAALLSECVVGAPGAADRVSFDYARLRGPSGRARLQTIRAGLLAIPPSRMTRAERTAWAINTYNFLVIEQVVHEIETRGGLFASVKDVKGFFSTPIVTVEGVNYSIDRFEHHFLFADFDRKTDMPPPSLDPRIHFAIVCAAVGCPPLAAQPYRPAFLDRDLDAVVRRALASPLHVRSVPGTDGFAISSIFDWYAKDFRGRAGVAGFLQRYGTPPLQAALRARGQRALTSFIPWDWGLNQSVPLRH